MIRYKNKFLLVSVNFKEDSISIVYKRFAPSSLASGLKLQLSGKQTSENCDFYNCKQLNYLSETHITNRETFGTSKMFI